MQYQLDFSDGWSHDRVVVFVGGREMCRLHDVTTRPATNLARSVVLDVADAAHGPLQLQVDVPDRDLRGSHELTPDRSLVVVDVGDGGLTFSSPTGPHGYA